MLYNLLLVLAVAAGQDPVEVGASLRSSRVRVGESTVLQISVETTGESPPTIHMPDLPTALEVNATQDFSQLKISYPGGRSRLLRRDVVLVPRAAGEYRIGPIDVAVAGRTYQTRPVILLVLPARIGDAPAAEPSPEVRLRAWLSADTAYVGQQILLHAEALFPQDLRLRQTRPASYDAPTPPDFWNLDVPESLALGLRSIDGDVYEAQIFRRAYFPLAPGDHAFPPTRLIYEMRRGFLYAPETRELASDSMRVTVLPLPAEGQPETFTGAVGRFTVSARVEPQRVMAGDATTMTVEIRGEGNVKALPAPRLPDLPHVEVYPPSEDARVETSDGVVRGVKRFSWVLIPERHGVIDIAPIEYAFFDPDTRTYQVASAVLPAIAVVAAATAGTGSSDEVLRDIAREPRGDAFGWVRTRWFAAVQALPLLALLLVAGLRRASTPRQPSRRRLRHARTARFDALRGAAPVEADRSFFGSLAGHVRESTADCLENPGLRTLPAAAFHRTLQDAGVGPATCADLSELLARLEHARFAPQPPSAAERRALLEEAERILDTLEREARPRRGSRATTAAGALLAALVATGPLHAAPEDFSRGVAAYEEGRYAEARAAFTRYVAGAERDATGWYNLGNVYHAEGDHGRAVWAWLRALHINPRYYAARHNLEATGADEAIRWLPPPFVPTLNEAILVAAVAWWVAAGITCLAILGRRKKWTIAAAGALLVGLLATAAALPGTLRRPTVVTFDAAPVLAGPAMQSEQIRTIAEGIPLGILERRGDWLRVRASDQTQGWVEARRVGSI